MKSRNIFISYRRQDTAGEAGRLADSLKVHFKDDQIFMDIETIDPGSDFQEAIIKGLRRCEVLLVLIGPNWLDLTGPSGQRRIDDPDDFIRLEIKEALHRNIRVIPVLVDGAKLPLAKELPDDISNLVKKQAYEISNHRWKFDTDQLITKIGKLVDRPEEDFKSKLIFSKKVIVLILIVIAIVLGFWLYPPNNDEIIDSDYRITDLRNMAGKVNQIVVHKSYGDLLPLMNDDTKKIITKELMDKINDSVNIALGEFIKPIDTTYSKTATDERFIVTNQYQNGITTTLIFFDQNKKVQGLWINPQPY